MADGDTGEDTMGGYRIAAAATLAVVVVLLVAGCSSSSGGNGGTASGGSAAVTLVAQGVSWNTTKLSFKTGENVTVTVQNNDGVEHNFTFEQAKANTDVEGGATAKATFTAPAAGTYEFHCEYHPAKMKGVVTITT